MTSFANVKLSPPAQSIMTAWKEALPETSQKFLTSLASIHEDKAIIGHAREMLGEALNIYPGDDFIANDHFVFKIMTVWDSHVGLSRGGKQGWPLIRPYRLIDGTIAGNFKEAKQVVKGVREKMSPELTALYVAWCGVIIPTMNTFKDVIRDGLGVPRHFPPIVESLVGLKRDIGELAERLDYVDDTRRRVLNSICADITQTVTSFAKKSDGNQELLYLDTAKRSEICYTSHAVIPRPSVKRSKAKRPKPRPQGQGTLRLRY